MHHLAIDRYCAGLRLKLAADQAQYGCFAGTGTTHDCNDLATWKVHLEARQNRAVPIAKLQITDFNEIGHGREDMLRCHILVQKRQCSLAGRAKPGRWRGNKTTLMNL